jgi:alkaline phosphatase
MSRTPSRAAAAVLALLPLLAAAQARVPYGRITAVTPTTLTDSTARNVGTIVGDGIGLATGGGPSASNRALRTVGGAPSVAGWTTASPARRPSSRRC